MLITPQMLESWGCCPESITALQEEKPHGATFDEIMRRIIGAQDTWAMILYKMADRAGINTSGFEGTSLFSRKEIDAMCIKKLMKGE